MRKIYCKYCGLELENDMCTCDSFLYPRNKVIVGYKNCDTCKSKIDADAIYCPYCGIPQNVDGNIKKLQNELKGVNAKDVIEVYNKKDRKKGIDKKTPTYASLISIILVGIILVVSITTFIMPVVRQMIDDYKMRKLLLETEDSIKERVSNATPHNPIRDSYNDEETAQPIIEIKDTWIKRDGYYYTFDENGDPVIDDWVTYVDEDGNEQKYYFDIEGKLVINSWINGEYYVGSDGAMLKNQSTPDGAFVDEEGKVVIQGIQDTNGERETYVYYEPTNSSDTLAATSQKSAISAEIKGVDASKKYELYVKSITQMRDTIVKGDLNCNVVYYMPVMDGKEAREVNKINNAIADVFVEKFPNQIRALINEYKDLPKSITLNVVNQRNVTKSKVTIIVEGKLIPRKGLSEKKKFRLIYDRKSAQLIVSNISD